MTNGSGVSDGAAPAVHDSTVERLVYGLLLVLCVLVTAQTYRTQQPIMSRYGDGDEYLVTTEQLVFGQKVTAEAPYCQRIALIWLVATLFPHNILIGYRVLNSIAAVVYALLLVAWLKSFGIGPGVRLLVVAMFIGSWLGPIRFVPFYPIYVDPPFLVLTLVALMQIRTLRDDFSWTGVWGLTFVCVLGTLFRETMNFIAIAFVFAGVRFRSVRPGRPIPLAAYALPLAGWLAAYVFTLMLPFEPRLTWDHTTNALFLFRTKPLFTLPLALFMTFGPIVTLVLYDWRESAAFMADHFYLVVFSGGCFLTGYVGGHETERYWFWAAPLAYLLIAQSIERHRTALLKSAWTFMALVLAQAVSERVFWTIPSAGTNVASFSELTTVAGKVYSVLNRLFVIDDFYWNLWSYFGSKGFHAVLLGLYVTFAALLVWRLRAYELGTRITA